MHTENSDRTMPHATIPRTFLLLEPRDTLFHNLLFVNAILLRYRYRHQQS